jgi:hypothetical protein
MFRLTLPACVGHLLDESRQVEQRKDSSDIAELAKLSRPVVLCKSSGSEAFLFGREESSQTCMRCAATPIIANLAFDETVNIVFDCLVDVATLESDLGNEE